MALGFLFFLGFTPAEACTPADGSGAVINEVYADPPGADAGLEWVELTLSGDRAAADLTGWTIAAGTRSLTSGVGFPPRELAPGTFAVIGNQEGLPALGNAGSGSADVVQLRDCAGVVADTVVYGAPNTDGFVDDLGTEATSLAPAPNPGGSIGRTPDGHDTDQSSDDFVRFDVPSPGAPNPLPPPCTSGSGVVINELLVNPEGADDPKEFVELHGAGPDPVELGGWSLVASTRSDTERSVVVPMDVAVEPGGFLVIGGSGRPDSHVVATLGLGNGD
ncbi:MAG: lamin tail domain-containing protein, partial [Myxococcota bacterium]